MLKAISTLNFKNYNLYLPFIKINDYFFIYNYISIFNKIPFNFELILKNQINFLNFVKETTKYNVPIYMYSSIFSYGYIYSLNFFINLSNKNLNRLKLKKGSVVILFENNIKQQILKEFGETSYTNLYVVPYSTKTIKKNLSYNYILINLDNDLYKYIYSNFIKYFIYKNTISFKKQNMYIYYQFFKKIYKI